MDKIEGAKYIGTVPDYLVIHPIKKLSDNYGFCTGCKSNFHFMNYETAFCPRCSSEQIKANHD